MYPGVTRQLKLQSSSLYTPELVSAVRDAGASIQHPGIKVYPKDRHGAVKNAGANIQHPGMKVYPGTDMALSGMMEPVSSIQV